MLEAFSVSNITQSCLPLIVYFMMTDMDVTRLDVADLADERDLVGFPHSRISQQRATRSRKV
ncbi:MAG: hypothetical protein WBM44_25440 [Waterburya sp.]